MASSINFSPASMKFSQSSEIPNFRFGIEKWKLIFGDVGVEPPIPMSLNEKLEKSCPFFPGKRVKDTHLLILMPSTVDGRKYTLDLLKELIQNPLDRKYRTRYSSKSDYSDFKVSSPEQSYWLLMTPNVMPETRKLETLSEKCQKLEEGSRIPTMLEAATAILLRYASTGEKLFGVDPLTYTYCQESSGEFIGGVGCFRDEGLFVGGLNKQLQYFNLECNGIACCWI